MDEDMSRPNRPPSFTDVEFHYHTPSSSLASGGSSRQDIRGPVVTEDPFVTVDELPNHWEQSMP
jgi:hypothetical protein